MQPAGAHLSPPFKTDRKGAWTGIALTLPALVALAATMIYPVGWTVWLSLNGPNTAMRGTKPTFEIGCTQFPRQCRQASPENGDASAQDTPR